MTATHSIAPTLPVAIDISTRFLTYMTDDAIVDEDRRVIEAAA